MLSIVVSFSLVLYSVAAAFVNYTIDDKNGDATFGNLPVYSTGWSQGQGSSCDGCFMTPGGDIGIPDDRPRAGGPAFDDTWHESLNNGDGPTSVQLTFTGSKIYIYGILFAYSSTVLSFKVDGVPASQGFYFQGQNNPITIPFFTFNTLFYSNENLTAGVSHTIEILNTVGSLALFDYAIYSREDSATTSALNPPTTSTNTLTTTHTTTPSPTTSTQVHTSSPASTAQSTQSSFGSDSPETPIPNDQSSNSASSVEKTKIIGGAVGGACSVIILIVVGTILVCRRRRKKREYGERRAMPFYAGYRYRPMKSSRSPPSSKRTEPSSQEPAPVVHTDSGWRAPRV